MVILVGGVGVGVFCSFVFVFCLGFLFVRLFGLEFFGFVWYGFFPPLFFYKLR